MEEEATARRERPTHTTPGGWGAEKRKTTKLIHVRL